MPLPSNNPDPITLVDPIERQQQIAEAKALAASAKAFSAQERAAMTQLSALNPNSPANQDVPVLPVQVAGLGAFPTADDAVDAAIASKQASEAADVARQDAIMAQNTNPAPDPVTPGPNNPDAISLQDSIMNAGPNVDLVTPGPDNPGTPSPADIFRQDSIMNAGPGNTGGQSSELILSVRGTFYKVMLSDQFSPGMYAIDELNKFRNEQEDVLQVPILLTGVEFTQSDITSEIPCLNNVKVFYTFGQNFGQVQITGEVLLGPVGEVDVRQIGFRLIRDFFYKYRVSRYQLPVAVSVASESHFVYLKGLRVGTIDPNFHIMPFVLFGTLLDLSREDAAKINPASVVVTTGNVQDSSLKAALNASRPEELVITDAVSSTSTSTTAAAATTPAPVTLNQNSPVFNAGKVAAAKTAVLQKVINGQQLTSDENTFLSLENTSKTLSKTENLDNPSAAVPLPNPSAIAQDRADLDNLRAVYSERVIRSMNGDNSEDDRPLSQAASDSLDTSMNRLGLLPSQAGFLGNPTRLDKSQLGQDITLAKQPLSNLDGTGGGFDNPAQTAAKVDATKAETHKSLQDSNPWLIDQSTY